MTDTAPQITTPMAALVEAVKAFAAENYEAGWDVVVETMDDAEIAERIGRARTPETAIAKVAELVGVQLDRRIDVLSQSGEHDAEVAELIEASKKGRGRSKTGHPKADRVISDAKIAKAATAAKVIDDAKTAEGYGPQPTIAEMRKMPIGEVRDLRALHVELADRATENGTPQIASVSLAFVETIDVELGRRRPKAKTAKVAEAGAEAAPAAVVEAPAKVLPTIALPAGYAVRWDNGAYDLAKRGDGAAEGAANWLVICKAHGTTTTAANVKEGDALGRRAGRATWCTGCQG